MEIMEIVEIIIHDPIVRNHQNIKEEDFHLLLKITNLAINLLVRKARFLHVGIIKDFQ